MFATPCNGIAECHDGYDEKYCFLPNWLLPTIILAVVSGMATALFVFITDVLLKVLGGNLENEMKMWFSSTTGEITGCLSKNRLEIAKLLRTDCYSEAVQKLFQDEIDYHGSEGEAMNCLLVKIKYSEEATKIWPIFHL